MDLKIAPVKIVSGLNGTKKDYKNNERNISKTMESSYSFVSYPKNYYLSNQINFGDNFVYGEIVFPEKDPKPIDDYELPKNPRYPRWPDKKKDPVGWATKWNEKQAKSYYDRLFEYRTMGKLLTKKDRLECQAMFEKEKVEAMAIKGLLKRYKSKFQDIENRQAELRNLKQLNEKLIQENKAASEIKQKINVRLNNPNAKINEVIGGYKTQKDMVNEGFLTPVNLEKENIALYNAKLKHKNIHTPQELEEAKNTAYNIAIPPSVLFYGCFGTGKNSFTSAIAAESDCHYEIYDSTSKESIDDFIIRSKEESKERYLTKGQRTIAVINEAERFFNNSGKDVVEQRNADFRDTLDCCSHNPLSGENGACGLSFFLTTNYPEKMQNIGILGRDSRMPLVVPVGPAEGEDLEGVLKFYIKKLMPEQSKFDADNYDYSEFIQKLQPNEDGCYNNDRLRAAMLEIRTNYDNNPSKSYQEHIEEGILGDNCKKLKHRNISLEMYDKYYDNLEKIGEG